jgi:hypothetical protein
MESEECPPRSHPSPTSGVEGSPRVSRLTTPTCPPASPSRGAGRLSLQAGTQQLFSPRHPSPSCTAPTWTHVARGGVAASFQPVPSTAQQLISPRHPSPSCTAPTWASVARGGTAARIQPASSTTPPSTFTLEDDRPPPPTPLSVQPCPTVPLPPVRTPSPTAPPPIKKARMR